KGRSVYFPNTESTNKVDAEREALIWTMQEAYAVAEKLYKEGVDKGLLEADSFGDYLC
ncbi:MAG: hypothetical protein GWO38_20555, partial [Phycisphaerae bacterium]|nr:hypothetical protein [Phycisphaerae bacterium]NIP55121.1 hypothetical protein [Phycisphaerae bacterium]NIX29957.1 hypothetical protein [Phycisphaerae bacterium]